MEFTCNDRKVLYNTWMSYKAKSRISQSEMAKKLGMGQLDFSKILRGDIPLEQGFIYRFFQEIDLDPKKFLPSFKHADPVILSGPITISTSIIVDGTVSKVEYKGNQVFIEFQKLIKSS